jgi:TetR/AcrR family transcriptional repressor of nem operon
VRALFRDVLDGLGGPKAPSRLCLMAASVTRDVLAEPDMKKYVHQEMSALAERISERLSGDKDVGAGV